MKQQHIDESAVAAGYNADRTTVLKHFDDALADRTAIPFVGSAPCGANEGRGASGIPA